MSILNKKIKDSVLVQLLEKFSRQELKGLNYFVACRHFNTDKYVVKLLEVIENEVLKKDTSMENMQHFVYRQVFEGSASSKELNQKEKATLNAKTSALTRLAERFLTIEALDANETYSSDLLYGKLLEKKQFSLFSRHANQAHKRAETNEQGSDYYEWQYKVNKNILYYLNFKGRLNKEDNLSVINEHLDVYYLLSKLDLHLTAQSLAQSFSKSYDFSDIEALQTLLKLPRYAEHPLIKAYLAAIELTQNITYEAYTDLLYLLDFYESKIPHERINDFYVTLTNFCADQIKNGKVEYYAHQLDLYKIMDTKNLILTNNVMSSRKLKNMISLSCRSGEYDWAVYVIEKYCPFVAKSAREDTRYFNLGAIEFYKKDYDKTRDYFLKIENMVNPVYDINLKMMTAKYRYELDNKDNEYKDETAQLFRSTENYIRDRKSIQQADRTSHKNFIRLLINLYRIRHRATKMTLQSLKNKIIMQDAISDKNWLLEKIGELE